MPGIVIQIQGDGTGAAEALQLIENKMRETAETGRETSDLLVEAGERIKRSLEYLGAYYAIDEVVDSMKELIGGSVELGEELGHVSRQTGISIQNLSLLKVASQESGVEFDALTKGFKRLSTALMNYQENSRTTVDAFKLLNISQKDLAATGGDVYKVMELVADRMSVMPDGWKKSAAATQLFGRAGQQLIPILDQGSAGIAKFKDDAENMGLVLDQQGTEKMEKFYEASAKLKLALEGLGIKITEAIEPAVTDLINKFTDGTISATDWAKATTSIAAASIQAAEAMNWLAQNTRRTFDELEEVYQLYRVINGETHAITAVPGHEQFGEQMKADAERRLAEIKADHDASLHEEKEFQAAMVTLHEELLHPGHKEGLPSLDELLPGLRLQGDKNNGVGKPSSGRGKHGKDEDEITTRSGNLIDREAKEQERQMQEVADAKLRLTEAIDRSEEQKAASHSSAMIQILEAQHSAGLEKDAEFYKAKLKLEEQMFDAEQLALERQEHDLQSALFATPANTQKSYEIQAQIVSIQTRLAELADRRNATEKEITAELRRQLDLHTFNGQSSSDNSDAKRRAHDAQMAANTVTQMLGQIMSAGGHDPLRQITNEMIQDVERLAMKMLEEQWILPMMRSLFGLGVMPAGGKDPLGLNAPATMDLSGLSNSFNPMASAGGGDINRPSLVGEKGPEMFVPKGPGTVLPNTLLSRISQSGEGGSHGPNVTVNVSNQSSQPVTMRQTGMSYDAQAKHFVLHTVLEDLSSGGPMSQAMRGFGGGS